MPINDLKLKRHHKGWTLSDAQHKWEIIRVGNKNVVLRRVGRDTVSISRPREQIQVSIDTGLLTLNPIDDGIMKFAECLREKMRSGY